LDKTDSEATMHRKVYKLFVDEYGDEAKKWYKLAKEIVTLRTDITDLPDLF